MHGNEPEHPVGQVVVPIHADGQIAARLRELKLELRSGGRCGRPCEKHTRDATDLSRCREQSVRWIVDSLEWRIRSRLDDEVVLAISNQMIAVGERRVDAGVRLIVSAQLRGMVRRLVISQLLPKLPV
jgi:hypothetical protein